MLRISSFFLVISLFAGSAIAQNKAAEEYKLTKLIVGGHVLDPTVLNHHLTGKFRSRENTVSPSKGTSVLDSNKAPTIYYKIYSSNNTVTGTPVTIYTIEFDDIHHNSASQILNSNFETWNEDGTLPYPWHTYKDAQITAEDVDRATLPAVERVEGRNGGFAVKITSNDKKVNGNLTTGIINIGSSDFSSTSNYNFTDRAITDGNVPLIGAPDEFECYVKMKCGVGNTEGGKISIIVHGEKPYRDPEYSSYEEVKLSSFSQVIPACDEWTEISGKFVHTTNRITGSDDKCYILFTATTNPTQGVSSGDELIIDDINLIYYHGLSDIKVKNVSIPDFNPDSTKYVVNGYAVSDLSSNITYTTKGKGSKVTKTKDGNDVILTVTAPDGNVTKYTITANQASSIITGITFLDGDNKETDVKITTASNNYTVNATYGGVAKIITKDLNAKTDGKYDEKTGIYTLKVKSYNYVENAGGFSREYNFQFNLPPAPLSYATVDGHTFLFGKDNDVKATGVYKNGKVSAFYPDDNISLESSYNSSKRMLTLTLSAENTYSKGTYTITYNNGKKSSAYQIPNSDFENWSDDNTLAESWNSFNNATGTLQAFASASPKITKVEGSEAYDGASVKLASQQVLGVAANGNLTTGAINMGSINAADAANYNFTDFAMKETNQPIKAMPDAFEVMAKYKAGTLVGANSEIALQARVQAIVHGPVNYQDPEIADQTDSKVALANVCIGKEGDVTEWTKFTGDFEYTNNTADNLYILVSATTNPTPGASYDDELYLDNFKLIYYHELSDIQVNGVSIPDFDSKKTSYIVSGDVKTINKALSYTTKGKSASVTKTIEGDVINITVTAADGEGSTLYTITVKKPSSLLSGVTFSDADWNDVIVEINDKQKEYKVSAMYDSVSEITTEDPNATTSVEYDEKTGVCTIIVTSSDYDQETSTGSQNTYKFQFNLPPAPLSYATVDGHTFYFTNKGDNLNVSGVYMGGSVTGFYSDEDVNVSINASYNENILTLALSADDTYSPKSYTITYADEKKAPAYQIPNSDFENWSDDNTLAESWNSFNNATGTLQAFASASPKITKVEGSEAYDGASVKLVSKNVFGIAAANGNLTTGAINMGSTTAADAANYNFTDFAMKETNQPIKAMPDAFEVMAKYKRGTLVGANGEVALQARVQAIVHGPVNYQDPEIADQTDSKVALANVYIGKEGDVTEWTKFTGDFEYTTNTAKDLYILVSATTNPTPGASYDDELYLDNFKLIYYHELSDIQVDGVTIPNFSSEQTEYTLDGNAQDIYDALTYTVKGHAATAEKTVIGSTITITVTAADGEQTIYTLNTNATAISHISFDEALTHEVYTLTGVKVARPSHPGLYIVDGQKTLIK